LLPGFGKAEDAAHFTRQIDFTPKEFPNRKKMSGRPLFFRLK